MATDRLRRRLGDAEHKTVASLKHDYCLIGTPLSALDSGKKDANELKPAWQQEVRDEQGRRRFHGAFTGGFSAGYFNTVGSKEGWTPSSFRSSRADKVNGSTVQNQARPEDFMDEEDLQDRKQNQQISMSNVFAQPSGKLNDLSPRGFDDVALIASAIYKETNASQLETLGFRLLRRMGWKEGQGLGARIDARKKQRLLSATSDDVKSLSETDLAAKHLFAPPQTTVPQVADHKHRHGLGWLPGTTLLNSQLSRVKFAPHVAPANNSLPVVRMAAQPDSDDEEDYFRDNEAWPVHARGKLDHGRTQTQIESGSRSQLTWRDGRKMLAGFQSSTSTEVAAPTHTTQLVPDAWTPDPMRVKAFLQAATLQTASAGPCGSLLTPAARGQVLGEAELPGPPPRMPAILVKYQNARSVDQVLKEQFVDVPRTDVATAKLALQGFMPFSNNPIKQGQYRSYLESQVRPAEEQARRQLVPPTHTQDDFLDLLDEFASSAAVSRLMSTTMANRFTSASATPSVNEQAFSEPGLRQPAPAQDSDEEHITTEEPRDLADTVQSAEVMAPDKTGKTCRSKIRADQHWQQNKEQLKAMAASSKPLSRAIEAKEMYLPAESTSMAQLGLGDDERQGSDTLSYARPSVDVYKAIFEPDDEEVETQVIPKQGDPPQAASQGSDLLASVTFRARSRRKADDLDDATKTRETFNDQKRKKEKRKGMLSFDIEEEINRPVPKAGRASDTQASELKASRIKAADMF